MSNSKLEPVVALFDVPNMNTGRYALVMEQLKGVGEDQPNGRSVEH